jgi:hypothetical protein
LALFPKSTLSYFKKIDHSHERNSMFSRIGCLSLMLFAFMATLATAQQGTTISGSPWQQLNGPWAASCNGTFAAITISPSDPKTIYIGSSDLTNGCGIFESNDGGNSWKEQNAGIGQEPFPSKHYPPIIAAVVTSNPSIAYISTYNPTAGFGYAYKTVDGGATWAYASGSKNLFNVAQVSNAAALAADPNDPATVYAGLLGGGVYKSVNGGVSWQKIRDGGTTPSAETVFHIVQFLDDRTLLTAGGTKIDGPVVVNIESDPSDPDTIDWVGVTPIVPAISTDGGQSWTYLWNIDGLSYGSVFFSDVKSVRLAGEWSTFAATFAEGTTIGGFPLSTIDPHNVLRVANRGLDWTELAKFDSSGTNYSVSALAVDLKFPNKLFAYVPGKSAVLGSVDAGSSWQSLPLPIGATGVQKMAGSGNQLLVETDAGIFRYDYTPRISVGVDGATRHILQGAKGTFTITVQSLGFFHSQVKLTPSDISQGITAVLSPSVVTPSPNGQVTSTLTITVPANATPNEYDFTVSATSDSYSAFSPELSVFVDRSAAPALSVAPTSTVAFGSVTVGSSSTQTFTVQNTVGGTLTGTASVAAPFSIVSGGSYSLTAGQSQAVTVKFAPTAAQSYNQNVTFTGGAGATRAVTGTGTPVAEKVNLTVASTTCYQSGPEINLSWSISGGAASTYDLWRNGLLYPAGTGMNGTTFSNYGSNVTVGQTYNYYIVAHLSTGSTVTSNTVSATAPSNCATPALTVTPTTTVAFGSVAVGSSSTQTFAVQNSGSGTLSGSASVSSPFSIVSGGSYSLAAGASQTVTVKFSPTAAQSYNQNVTFTGGAGATRAVTGTGTQVAAKVSLTVASTTCYQSGPEINLSWSISGGAASTYDLWRNGLLYPAGTGMNGTTFSNYGSNVTAGQIYNYYIVAHLSTGSTVTSNTVSATAPSNCAVPPTVTTLATTNISSSGGTMNGSVNPNGLSTTVWFQWGTTSALGQNTGSATTSGTTASTWNSVLSGRAQNTTIYYRIAAQNSAGTNYGSTLSFTTTSIAQPPTVTTLAATNISSSGGTMNGSVNPNGLSTTVWFQWGTTSALGQNTGSATTSGTTTASWNSVLSGRAQNITFYYRIAAQNSAGTSYGSTLSFKTL